MKLEKSKYKGVFLDPKTNKYCVQTTFKTKDGFYIKKCKRGFKTAKEANLWKNKTAIEISGSNIDMTINQRTEVDVVIEKYIAFKSQKYKLNTNNTNSDKKVFINPPCY